MKKPALPILLLICLLGNVVQAQNFIQIGTQFVEDQGRRLIYTSDGGYITAGSAGSKAMLYKSDCQGNLVAQIEKVFIPGPATFWDVAELADGSLVAVGSAGITELAGTGNQVILLKTTSNLVEIASSSFKVLDKVAQGRSLAKTPAGELLVWGEVTGDQTDDFTDAFFQRVSAATLMPVAEPVIFNHGVDQASRILPTADGNYLLTGSSFLGNIADPNAIIESHIRAFKVDGNGALLWTANVGQNAPAKYGVAQCCGAAQSIQSGNFMIGGTLFNGTDVLKQDMFFALVRNDGAPLDSIFAFAAGQQKVAALAENTAAPGAYLMLGESDGSPLGLPSLAIAQVYETGDQLLLLPTLLDISNLASLRDLVQIDAGRFAIMACYPDNGATFSPDIVVSTPMATVGVVYQNCALAATFSIPAVAFQWLLEGQAIPGANQGVFFPTKPGLYSVQVLDATGCFGVSDTLRVDGPKADFTVTPEVLTATFFNTSQGATMYAWDFGDGSTSTQPAPTHTYAATGVYTVRLIASNNCLKDTIIQQIGVTPTSEANWLTYFSLSPNPTEGVFSLTMSGTPQSIVEFALYNSVGQLTLVGEQGFQNGWLQKTFYLEHLPDGVYYLQIRSGKELKTVQVLKG